MFMTSKQIGCCVLLLAISTCSIAFGQHRRGGFNPERPGKGEGGGQANPADILNGIGGILGGLGTLNPGGGGNSEEEDDDEGYYEPDYYPSQPNYYPSA